MHVCIFVEGIQYPTARVKLALTGCDFDLRKVNRFSQGYGSSALGLTWPRIHSSPLARGIKTKTMETKLNYIQNRYIWAVGKISSFDIGRHGKAQMLCLIDIHNKSRLEHLDKFETCTFKTCIMIITILN